MRFQPTAAFCCRSTHSPNVFPPPEERLQACVGKKKRKWWKWHKVNCVCASKEQGYLKKKKLGGDLKKMFWLSWNVLFFFRLPFKYWGEAWETIVIQRLNLKFNLWTPLQRSVSRELLFRQNKAIKTEHGWNYCGVKPAKLLFWAQHFYVPKKKRKKKKI